MSEQTNDDQSRMDTTGPSTDSRTAPTGRRVLTIDRSKWRRGGDGLGVVESLGFTYLRNSKGLMCCLGFDALACGLSPETIDAQPDPVSLYSERLLDSHEDYRDTRVVVKLERDEEDDYCREVARLSDAAERAVNHNDDPALADAVRERLIREDLIALGWDDVVFIDGPEE